MKPRKKILLTISIALFGIGNISTIANGQTDQTKHWYTTFTNATYAAKGAGCSIVNIAFKTAPNMRENSFMTAPVGYTRQFVNNTRKRTGGAGGWCPKTMTMLACEKREKLRARYFWHNALLTRGCATVRWNGTVLFSK